MTNRVTEMLGCRYPIIQGAMGIISNPEMVAAVSDAGGYGFLATAFADNVDIVEKQVTATKTLTDKPFGANLFMMRFLWRKGHGGILVRERCRRRCLARRADFRFDSQCFVGQGNH